MNKLIFFSKLLLILFIFVILFFLSNFLFDNNLIISILNKEQLTESEIFAIKLSKYLYFLLVIILINLTFILFFFKNRAIKLIEKYSKFFFHNHVYKFTVFLALFIFFLIIIVRFIFIKDNNNPLELLGLNSFRATHWLINYYDLGFIKRGLLGTFNKFLFGNYFSNFIFILIGSFFIQFIVLTNYFLLTKLIHKKIISYSLNLLLLLFITSPCFIYFYFSDNGRLDQVNNFLMISSIIIILISHHIYSFILIGILSFIATLIHESFFLLQFPLIFLTLILFSYRNKKDIYLYQNYLKILIPLLSVSLALIVLVFFGYTDPNVLPNHQIYDILNKSADFTLSEIGTFDRRPWQDFHPISYSANSANSFIYTFTSFLIINFPFLLTVFFIWKKIFSFKLGISSLNLGMILLICFFPLLISQIMTFNDDYRVYASFALHLQIASLILLSFVGNSGNSLNTLHLSNFKFGLLALFGILYNLFQIIFHLLTTSSLSSYTSPISYILFYLFNF